jgi:uncharacterized protein (DUF2236 family)
VTGHELTGYPLSEADRQALYLESIDWHRLYGVSVKPSRRIGMHFSSTGNT